MPTLTLPEGLTVELPEGEPVGAALPKGAIAARVDGELRDLSFVPAHDAVVEPIHPRSDDGLRILRHSTAHVLAQAVCELYPGTRSRAAHQSRWKYPGIVHHEQVAFFQKTRKIGKLAVTKSRARPVDDQHSRSRSLVERFLCDQFFRKFEGVIREEHKDRCGKETVCLI